MSIFNLYEYICKYSNSTLRALIEIPLSTDASNSLVKKEARLWQSNSKKICSVKMKSKNMLI